MVVIPWTRSPCVSSSKTNKILNSTTSFPNRDATTASIPSCTAAQGNVGGQPDPDLTTDKKEGFGFGRRIEAFYSTTTSPSASTNNFKINGARRQVLAVTLWLDS
jgi:hypothetical protein